MNRVLSQALLDNGKFWENKNVELPQYNRNSTQVTGLCFSPGRMGYGHLGDILQDILNKNGKAGMVVGVETYAGAYFADLVASDFLVTQLIYQNEKGQVTPKVQGAFSGILFLDNNQNSLSWQKLLEMARNERICYATINAPESVYGMRYEGGEFAIPVSDTVKEDMEKGTTLSDPAKWTRFALERFKAGLKFAFVSCTNFSQNGYFTGAVVRTIGRAWEQKGLAPEGFLAYLLDKYQIGFPNTMVDRIAVSPDSTTEQVMGNLGIKSQVVVTEKTRYWAIEDVFPGGRPEFEKAEGVFMCKNFEEVKKYEDMKLRILNMSHTTIASLGVLEGYRGPYGVYRAMQDEHLLKVIKNIMSVARDVLQEPTGLNVSEFIKDTLTRLNNANIPDDPMRIALNGSQKILPRLMETYWAGKKANLAREALKIILLPVAGFLRYTLGLDNKGEKFELAPDPILETLTACGNNAKAGISAREAFKPLLSDKSIMGENLFEQTEVLDDLLTYLEPMML